MRNGLVDSVLENLFAWEMSRPDYPFVFAVHPYVWNVLRSEVPHMCTPAMVMGEPEGFRGIRVVFVMNDDREYFEFMDSATVKERAGNRDDGTWSHPMYE